MSAAVSWRRWAAVEHGDILLTAGNTATALELFRISINFVARLAAADPGNAEWQRDLSVSHERVGDVLRAQGELPRALDAYRAAMDITARLAAADPGNAQWQRDLSFIHERIGIVLRAQGDLPGALAAYRAGLLIDERLAREAPDNAQVQRDLFVSLREVARLSASTGDCAIARTAAAKAEAQARLLVERFPHLPQHEDDLRGVKALLEEIARLCP